MHTIIAIFIISLFYLIGLHYESALVVSAFYFGREHAQAEYRTIYTNYGNKRANAPWWCGFELRAWDVKSCLDWIGPVAVATTMLLMLGAYCE